MIGSDVMRVKFRGSLRVAGIVLLGACFCTGAAGPSTEPAKRFVKLSDAIPLNKLTVDNLEANFTDKLTPPATTQAIYFGELDDYGNDPDNDEPIAALPIIAVRSGDGWLAVPLTGEAMRDAGWHYVAAGPGAKEIWGAIDTVAGDSRSSFVLAHSTDGGETFEMTVFRKPTRRAEFFDFAMSADGHGRATVSLDADAGSHKAGLYHYQTNDDGKTWSAPVYEPDAMKRAVPVPDEEQPDEPSQGTQTSIRSDSTRMAVACR
jgi:hypothetical protein